MLAQVAWAAAFLMPHRAGHLQRLGVLLGSSQMTVICNFSRMLGLRASEYIEKASLITTCKPGHAQLPPGPCLWQGLARGLGTASRCPVSAAHSGTCAHTPKEKQGSSRPVWASSASRSARQLKSCRPAGATGSGSGLCLAQCGHQDEEQQREIVGKGLRQPQ